MIAPSPLPHCCPPIAPADVPECPIPWPPVLIERRLRPATATAAAALSCFSEFEGGAPSKDRTCDLGFRKALLYPTELRGRAAEAVTSLDDAQALSRFTLHFTVPGVLSTSGRRLARLGGLAGPDADAGRSSPSSRAVAIALHGVRHPTPTGIHPT